MKTFVLSATFAVLSAISAAAQDIPKVVTLVTSPDPQIQLMAMVLTTQAVENGATAHVLLCGQAGDMALQDAPSLVTLGQQPVGVSSQGMMEVLRQYDGTVVEVCAIYLPSRGVDQSVLLDGVGVATPNQMASQLMDPDARVLSF